MKKEYGQGHPGYYPGVEQIQEIRSLGAANRIAAERGGRKLFFVRNIRTGSCYEALYASYEEALELRGEFGPPADMSVEEAE